MQVCCGRLNRLDSTCFCLNQRISNAGQGSNKPSCIFRSYQLFYSCRLGKLKCFVEENWRWQVPCLLEHLFFASGILFLFPGHPSTHLPASGVPSGDLCVVGWQGMRHRLQSWPASCWILYSSACDLSTGDQKPRGTGLRLLGEFLTVV